MNSPTTASSSAPTTADPQGSTSSSTTGPDVHAMPSCSFGSHIESIARWCGLHPADVALGIAGVLGNIAGPHAGLVDSNGGRVHPHLSLLFAGPSSPRWQMLEHRLFQPLRKRADWLRQRACSQSRQLGDRFIFGAYDTTSAKKAGTVPHLPFWLGQLRDDQDEKQRLLINLWGLPSDQFDEKELMSSLYYPGQDGDPVRRGPGAAHLPSFFFEGIELGQISAALSESIHREALLVAPTGGVFTAQHTVLSKDDAQAGELVTLMKGRDMSFVPLHPDQGHGTFEHARVHLWAAIPLERIGGTLHDENSGWRQLYQRCLVCEPSPWKSPETSQCDVPQALRRFDQNVQDLLEARCFNSIDRQRRLGMEQYAETWYWKWQEQYLEHLAKYTGPDSVFTAHFHDLPGRLFWTFKQFYKDGERAWSLKAAFETAKHAVQQHVHVLNRAHEKYATQLALKAIEQVTAILRNKGPVKLRDIQRSCNNRSAGYFKPALTLMQQQGCLRIDADKRLHLIAQS